MIRGKKDRKPSRAQVNTALGAALSDYDQRAVARFAAGVEKVVEAYDATTVAKLRRQVVGLAYIGLVVWVLTVAAFLLVVI